MSRTDGYHGGAIPSLSSHTLASQISRSTIELHTDSGIKDISGNSVCPQRMGRNTSPQQTRRACGTLRLALGWVPECIPNEIGSKTLITLTLTQHLQRRRVLKYKFFAHKLSVVLRKCCTGRYIIRFIYLTSCRASSVSVIIRTSASTDWHIAT